MKNNLLNSITILLCGVLTLIHLFEFYTVAIRKETEFYPFGGEGPVPYYYRTAELYSIVNLAYGLIFGFLFLLAIWNLRNKKLKAKTLFGLTMVAGFILLIHSWLG